MGNRFMSRLTPGFAAWVLSPWLCAAAPAADLAATPTVAVRHAASPQLLSNEVAVLLEHLQSQHVYLKHLENTRRAVEKELSIVRLMRECDGFGSVCTGRGITEKPAPPEAEHDVGRGVEPAGGSEIEREIESGPEVESEIERAAGRELLRGLEHEDRRLAPPPQAYAPPVVAGVYRDVAALIYAGRVVEVRAGARVGPFTVAAVELDRVELNGPQGTLALPVRWGPAFARFPRPRDSVEPGTPEMGTPGAGAP